MIRTNLIGACLFTLLITGFANTGAQEIPEYSRSYDPDRDPFTDSNKALQYATQTGRRVLIALGGDWCSYCLQLDDFITGDQQLHAALYDRFVVLKINVSEDNMNEDFRAGLPEINGYPHFFISRSDGSILYSKDTSQLLEDGTYSRTRFLQFLEAWGPEASEFRETGTPK